MVLAKFFVGVRHLLGMGRSDLMDCHVRFFTPLRSVQNDMPAERSDLSTSHWDCRVGFFTPLRSVQNDMPAERSDLSTSGTAVLDSSLRCAPFRMTCRPSAAISVPLGLPC